MLAKLIHYEKLVNLGNFQNEKLGIDVEIEPGETVQDAILRARAQVEQGLAAIARARDEEQERALEEQRRRMRAYVPSYANDPSSDDDPELADFAEEIADNEQ